MPENLKTTILTHNALNLTVDDTDYVSRVLNVKGYEKLLLLYRVTENDVLVDGDRLIFRVEFADRADMVAGNWHIYQNGPFGYLAEEESTTPCNKSVSGECVGEYLRVTVRTDYTNVDPTTKFFTVTVKVTLMK